MRRCPGVVDVFPSHKCFSTKERKTETKSVTSEFPNARDDTPSPGGEGRGEISPNPSSRFVPQNRSRRRKEAEARDLQCAPPPHGGGYKREVHGEGGRFISLNRSLLCSPHLTLAFDSRFHSFIHLLFKRLVIQDFVKINAGLHLGQQFLLRAPFAERLVNLQRRQAHHSKRG